MSEVAWERPGNRRAVVSCSGTGIVASHGCSVGNGRVERRTEATTFKGVGFWGVSMACGDLLQEFSFGGYARINFGISSLTAYEASGKC